METAAKRIHDLNEAARNVRPESNDALWNWIARFTAIQIANCQVCQGHQPPWAFFRDIYLKRPSTALVLGSRGGGKSFLTALSTHLTSRWTPRHETKILGGSRSQSEQVYRALRDIVQYQSGEVESVFHSMANLKKESAAYKNGSEVSILSASSTSVRGPHVPSLKLDEVDEIPPDLREAALGMCMNRNGSVGSVVMSSTWHRLDGPMSDLMDRARNGEYPLYTFCAFEVLERCPAERSGKFLEKCPACPLLKYCHDVHDGGLPKAKRSNGHYAIDALIQKIKSTSIKTFESDYLCLGPRSEGLWFPAFSTSTHVSERAEFDWNLPIHISIDSGVFTGAVFFQVASQHTPEGFVDEIRVFADYLAEGLTAEQNAREILEVARKRCSARYEVLSTDPAGGSRNPIGPSVIAEYERVGLKPMRRWPIGSVSDGLALLDSFVTPADGRSRFMIHPRCEKMIRAMQNYRRAKRAGQWQDYPQDPQHPQEDLVDAIRGGLRVCFPEGRCSKPNLTRVPARQVF